MFLFRRRYPRRLRLSGLLHGMKLCVCGVRPTQPGSYGRTFVRPPFASILLALWQGAQGLILLLLRAFVRMLLFCYTGAWLRGEGKQVSSPPLIQVLYRYPLSCPLSSCYFFQKREFLCVIVAASNWLLNMPGIPEVSMVRPLFQGLTANTPRFPLVSRSLVELLCFTSSHL